MDHRAMQPANPNSPPLALSLFDALRARLGDTVPVIRCTKATLVHVSHTLEDLVLRNRIPALLFTGFQESSHWRHETERYRALAEVAQQVCVFAGGSLPPESNARQLHVRLRGDDPLRQEWFVVLLSAQFAALLCGQDRAVPVAEEATRQFDTILSFEPTLINQVLDLLEEVIGQYRPERLAALQEARRAFPPTAPNPQMATQFITEMTRFEEELNQQLVATMAALHAQLQWRDDLAATLVHDLRAPLQGLAMSIDLLQRAKHLDAAIVEQVVAVAGDSIRDMRELVDLILDTTQLAAGRMPVVWQPLPAESFLEEAVAPLQSLLDAKRLTVDIATDPGMPIIWGDAQLLRRVVQNLVDNAIKYSAASSRILLGVAANADGTKVELRVRDTGEGIGTSALARIFDRYYRGREGSGSSVGLGLYFCRLAAEAHGGYIRAISKLGTGTTITVVLPNSAPRR